jgi:tRNA (guanine-N7-)-methyltransferase
LTNLVFLKAEAEECVTALPPHVRLQRIFVLFPDPWPKRRHHKHRIMHTRFLHAIAARAESGADLCFRTDDAPYFAAAKTVVSSHRDWEVSAAHWPFERATVFQSRAAVFQSLMAVRREVSAKL